MLRTMVRIARLGMMKSLFSLALWEALISVPKLTSALVPPTAEFFIVLIAGIAANMASVKSTDACTQAELHNERSVEKPLRQAIPWRILAAQVLVLFSLHALRSLFDSDVKGLTAIGFLGGALIVMVVASARQRIFALRTYYNASLILIELAILLLAFLPAEFALGAGIIACFLRLFRHSHIHGVRHALPTIRHKRLNTFWPRIRHRMHRQRHRQPVRTAMHHRRNRWRSRPHHAHVHTPRLFHVLFPGKRLPLVMGHA